MRKIQLVLWNMEGEGNKRETILKYIKKLPQSTDLTFAPINFI